MRYGVVIHQPQICVCSLTAFVVVLQITDDNDDDDDDGAFYESHQCNERTSRRVDDLYLFLFEFTVTFERRVRCARSSLVSDFALVVVVNE